MFNLEQAKRESQAVTWDSLNELPNWVGVTITDCREAERQGRPYYVVTFTTDECKRSFNISFWQMKFMVGMFNALDMTQCNDHQEIIGKKLLVKLAVDQNETTNKRYIRIESYRNHSLGKPSKATPTVGDDLELPTNNNDETPF